MLVWLVLLFIAVPLVELYVIVETARSIGTLETIGLLILVSVVGAWMVKAQGLAVLWRVRSKLAEGLMPGRELMDGALVLLAGALMLTPGFVTDAVGLLLLFPPTRMAIRPVIIRRFRHRVTFYGPEDSGPGTIHDTDLADGD
ncbi:MAG: FxsA family protein [Acidimicrobiia bacterium]|nr:FxsA family protein [Acidimicrobiia bacterium]MYG71892.1 FxsA family protein [Acidimicrobiia bacterium]